MSTTPPQLPRVVREYIAAEKESARVWLRAEIDRFVGPLVDSVFDRLTNKLMAMNLDWDRILPGDASERLVDLVKREIKEEIKEENEMTLQNVADNVPKANEQIGDCVKLEIKEEEEDGQMLDIKKEEEEGETNEVDLDDTNEGADEDEVNPNNATDIDTFFVRSMRDEVELGEPTRSNVNLNPILHQTHNADTSLANVSTSSNEPQSNLINREDHNEDQVNPNPNQQQSDDAEASNNEGMIDDGDETTEIDSGNGERIEDNQNDEPSRPVVNGQMDTTPPTKGQSTVQSTRQPKRKQTNDKQQRQVTNKVNNRNKQDVVDEVEEESDDDYNLEEGTSRSVKRSRSTTSSTKQKQIITHTLRCPQVGCAKMIAEDEFNLHMWEKHSIRRHRCVVKDCKQSFDKKKNMSEHLAQSHQSTSQWLCDKCDHHSTTYPQLSRHNTDQHQLGHFQCSFSACPFTGEYKQKVYDHYKLQHKTRKTLKCDHPGCQYQTTVVPNLKKHQRVHSGIKPYRCKWPDCDYSSTGQSDTMKHIRRSHLKGNPQLGGPKDYLEVVRDLL